MTAGCVKERSATTEWRGTVWYPRMPKLRACPFCGREDPVTLVRYEGPDGFRDRFAVLCDYREGGCGAEGPWYHDPEEAAEAWNRRV